MAATEPDRRDLDIYDRQQEIPDDEKRQILDQIEKSISNSSVTAGTGPSPKKKSYIFPMVVNLAAVVVMIAVVVSALRTFEVRREKLNLEIREVSSAEGKILAEFKREAEEKLKEKDVAILRVLKQLGSLERERAQLSRIMELRIQEKEREMRGELAAELRSRRESLQKEDLSAADIESQLLALETERKRQIFEELQAFQAEIDSLTRQKEQQLLREREAAKLSLEQATLEREELLLSTQQEEIELVDRIRPEEGGIVVPAGAKDQLSKRQALAVQERLAVDQITGSFMVIAAKLAGKRYDEASADLKELEAIYLDETVAGLPAVERRKASDLRIISAFRALIAQATERRPVEEPEDDSADAASLPELRREIQEKEQEIEQLSASLEQKSAEIVDTEKLAVEARSSAYREILRTISRFEGVNNEQELEALSRELASESADESWLNELIAALESLTAESFPPPPVADVSYRILGTVTLVSGTFITVLPIANLALQVGDRIEVRRLLNSGEVARIAVGTLTDVQGEKLVARIDCPEAQVDVAVTDKVYLIVD